MLLPYQISPLRILCTKPLYHKVLALRAYSTSLSSGASTPTEPAPPPVSLPQEKWDIYASLCIERKAIITPEFTPLEKKYSQLFAEIEFESSYKSNHEIRHEKDTILLEKIRKGEVEDGTSGNVETAQDFEDTVTSEFLKFVPMSRNSEDVDQNDTKSLQRALDSPLILLIHQILGKDTQWVCPQRLVSPGQTLRSTADQLLSLTCPNLKAKILGNAPFGFFKYNYPKDIRQDQGITGAKVFFYKANYLSGTVDKELGGIGKDFAWLRRSELQQKLLPKYHKALSKFLIPE